MNEWIGNCQECGIGIYCENGFFNGVLLPGHKYRCFDCDEKIAEEEDEENDS